MPPAKESETASEEEILKWSPELGDWIPEAELSDEEKAMFKIESAKATKAALAKLKLRKFAKRFLKKRKDKLLDQYVRVNVEHNDFVRAFGQSGLVMSISEDQRLSVLTKENGIIEVPKALVHLEPVAMKPVQLRNFQRVSQTLKIAFLSCIGFTELISDELEPVTAKKPNKLSCQHIQAWGALLSWSFFEKVSVKVHNWEISQIFVQPDQSAEEKEELKQGLLRTGDC